MLPDSSKIPSSGLYKLEIGNNRMRIIEHVDGYSAWMNKKPIKRKTKEEFKNMELDEQRYGDKIKYFWLLLIFDIKTKKIRTFEIIQPSIMTGLKKLEDNETWGDVKQYNINILKEVKGGKSAYVVMAEPDNLTVEEKKQIETEKKKVNLSNVFEGKNPFNDKSNEIEYEDEPSIDDVDF